MTVICGNLLNCLKADCVNTGMIGYFLVWLAYVCTDANCVTRKGCWLFCYLSNYASYIKAIQAGWFPVKVPAINSDP